MVFQTESTLCVKAEQWEKEWHWGSATGSVQHSVKSVDIELGCLVLPRSGRVMGMLLALSGLQFYHHKVGIIVRTS